VGADIRVLGDSTRFLFAPLICFRAPVQKTLIDMAHWCSALVICVSILMDLVRLGMIGIFGVDVRVIDACASVFYTLPPIVILFSFPLKVKNRRI